VHVPGWLIVVLILVTVLLVTIALYVWRTRDRNWEGSTVRGDGRRDHEQDDPPWERRGPSYGAGGQLGGGGSGQ
jgi:hypothetical protein